MVSVVQCATCGGEFHCDINNNPLACSCPHCLTMTPYFVQPMRDHPRSILQMALDVHMVATGSYDKHPGYELDVRHLTKRIEGWKKFWNTETRFERAVKEVILAALEEDANNKTKEPKLRVFVENGKYEVVQDANGSLYANRNGQYWRDLTGDKLILCLAQELQKAREHQKENPP